MTTFQNIHKHTKLFYLVHKVVIPYYCEGTQKGSSEFYQTLKKKGYETKIPYWINASQTKLTKILSDKNLAW